MNKLFFTVAAVVALTFTLASCKKDRTCTCTDSDGDISKTEYKKVSKAEADCVSTTYTNANGDKYTTVCELD